MRRRFIEKLIPAKKNLLIAKASELASASRNWSSIVATYVSVNTTATVAKQRNAVFFGRFFRNREDFFPDSERFR